MSGNHILAVARRLAFVVVIGACFLLRAAADDIEILSATNLWKYNDESVDLGTGWIATNYNDSAWSNSYAAIGFRAANNGNYPLPPPSQLRSIFYETNYTTNLQGAITTNILIRSFIRKATPTNAVSDIMTFYFRRHFTFTNDPGGMVLMATNLIDDGAIFYINGREVQRLAMPDGPVTWGTPATRNEIIQTNGFTHDYEFFSVPVDALVQGDNVMAVEVHQGSTASSAMCFQTELWASYPAPTFLFIANQPEDLSVQEGTRLSIPADVSGGGGHYQWYRQGVGAIPGAIGDRYYIGSASTNDTGMYYFIVSNSVNSVTSRVFRLTVTIDLEGPSLLSANGSISTTNVLVSFSDPILASSATNAAGYKITNTLGGTINVTRAVIVNTTNVMLTSTNARVPNNNYILIVNGVRDTSVHTNLITANSMIPISNLATNIVGLGSGGWRYYDPYPPFDAPNLGTEWRYPDYVETNTWADGSSVFRFNTSPPGPAGSSLSQTPVPITYFRLPLGNYQFGAGTSNFFLTHIIDDGAIFYLNGTEFLRVNMPVGPVNYQTTASSAVTTASRVGPISVSAPWRSGGNVLAVELHQATASADIDKAFGIQLDGYVLSVPIGPAIITAGPSDVTVTEGDTATFSVSQVGGTSFQWQQNNGNINGATDLEYTTPPATLGMNNYQYRIMVSGANGTVTSTNARLHVLADTNRPVLVGAYADADSILVHFSENMNAASATTIANYTITNSAGQVFTPTAASLTNGTDVVLSFAGLSPAIYFVAVKNVKDASAAGNVIATNSFVQAGFSGSVQNITGDWKYDQSNVSLGTAWRDRTFNDSAWPVGTAVFNGKSSGTVPALPSPAGTVLDVRRPTTATTNIPTYYFRTHFNSYAAGTGSVTFQTIVDDGCVVYLNGVELQRLGMPAGTINFGTFASRTVGDINDAPSYEGPFTVPVTNLVVGDNVIAVEVHQAGSTSSDVYWAGEFSVFAPSTVPIYIPPPPACTNIALVLPTLRFQRVSGTNTLLSWTNPATNTCGSNAVFTLQQTLSLSNPVSASRWTNVTAVSPYTAIGTNTRFFRLKF